jgi:hypothetical protein
MVPRANPSAEAVQVLAPPEATTAPKIEQTSEEQPYWGDRFALVFWVWCFALMALMHVVDIILSLFR